MVTRAALYLVASSVLSANGQMIGPTKRAQGLVLPILSGDLQAMTATQAPRGARNLRLVDLWYRRMWNNWDKTAIAEICHEDIVFRGSLGEEVKGHAGVAQYMDRIRAAFPDFLNVIEDTISENDKVFARLTYRGTHQGTVLGFAPTGKRVTYVGAAVFTVRKNKIASVWVLGDLYNLVQQLTPSPRQ